MSLLPLQIILGLQVMAAVVIAIQLIATNDESAVRSRGRLANERRDET
jgi:hypothetical protein